VSVSLHTPLSPSNTNGKSNPFIEALPTVILNSPAVSDPAYGGSNPKFGTGYDIAGIIIFWIGLSAESLGDIQKVIIGLKV
jgi:hypothetical protein